MDLITFHSGIESIQPGIEHVSQPPLPQAKTFVPLGQSIEQHTANLFNKEALNTERLRELAEPESKISLDASTFTDLIKSTLHAVKQITEANKHTFSEQEAIIHQQAVEVIADLDSDRHLLLTHLQALNRV